MYKITIPDDVILRNEQPLAFRRYIADVIAPLPFWRTRDGVALSEELFALIDSDGDTFDLSNDLKQSLEDLMQLSDNRLGQLNPQLARASIVFVRAVYNAEKIKPAAKTK